MNLRSPINRLFNLPVLKHIFCWTYWNYIHNRYVCNITNFSCNSFIRISDKVWCRFAHYGISIVLSHFFTNTSWQSRMLRLIFVLNVLKSLPKPIRHFEKHRVMNVYHVLKLRVIYSISKWSGEVWGRRKVQNLNRTRLTS